MEGVKEWGKLREGEQGQLGWAISENGLKQCQWLTVIHGNTNFFDLKSA